MCWSTDPSPLELSSIGRNKCLMRGGAQCEISIHAGIKLDEATLGR